MDIEVVKHWAKAALVGIACGCGSPCEDITPAWWCLDDYSIEECDGESYLVYQGEGRSPVPDLTAARDYCER